MALADSKGWRVHASSNMPPSDVEVSDGGFKNVATIFKILPYSVPAGMPPHVTRLAFSDVVPDGTTYPDAYFPIGSCVCRLIVNGSGVVTGSEMYHKNAAGSWVLYSPPGAVAAAKTAAYTVTTGDRLVLADTSGGAFTATLPAAADMVGVPVTFKNTGTGTNALTIDGDGSETIDGATTNATMDAQYDTLTLMSDGSNWHIIASSLA